MMTPAADSPRIDTPFPGQDTGPSPDSDIYESFLSLCRPVVGHILEWLTKDKGITEEVAIALKLRFCGREYREIINALMIRFGAAALQRAGLLKWSEKVKWPLPSFWHYYAKEMGFLVIPYLMNGRPVYLQVRPTISREEAERRDIAHFMDTATAVPCLYNVDILNGRPEELFICQSEPHTWTALSQGHAAVGLPATNGFEQAWVEPFRPLQNSNCTSKVYLVVDAENVGKEKERVIDDLFLKAGLPVPLKLVLPPGTDLLDCIRGVSSSCK